MSADQSEPDGVPARAADRLVLGADLRRQIVDHLRAELPNEEWVCSPLGWRSKVIPSLRQQRGSFRAETGKRPPLAMI
jgi:hypothetical protein